MGCEGRFQLALEAMRGEKEISDESDKQKEEGHIVTIKVWGVKEDFNWEALTQKISLVNSWVETWGRSDGMSKAACEGEQLLWKRTRIK